jgi:hypothetical protein
VKDEIYVMPIPLMLNNLKDRIRTATAKIDGLLLQNVWQEVKYRFDVCRVPNGAYNELS